MMPTYRTPDPLRPAAAVLAALALTLPWLAAQDEKKPERREEPDPKIEAKLETFEDAIRDRRFQRDGEAAGIVREIVEEHVKKPLHEKDVRDVVRSFYKTFSGRRRKPDDMLIYTEVAKAFGSFEDEGARMAVTVYERFEDKEWMELRKKLLEAIGETKSPKQASFLVKEAVNSPEDYVKASAGLALRHYKDSDLKLKREIVKDLIRDYARIEGITRANIDPGDPVVARFKQTLRAVKDNWNQALGELTGENHRTASDWQHWYNKNKNSWGEKRRRRTDGASK